MLRLPAFGIALEPFLFAHSSSVHRMPAEPQPLYCLPGLRPLRRLALEPLPRPICFAIADRTAA